ncbi:MAG: serine hydrolase [Rhizobium sp.]|nr:serine hydrolase [Rhizobium sp.]
MTSRNFAARISRFAFRGTNGRLRNGWWILAFYLLLAAMLVGTTLALPGGPGGVSPVVQTVLVLVVTAACLRLRRESFATLLGRRRDWVRGVPLGLALAAGTWGAVAAAAWLAGAVHWQPGTAPGPALLQGAASALVVAVLEELVFRGFVFQRLVDGVGAWLAQLLMAAYFVLTHSQGLAGAGELQWLAGANIFLAGLVFGTAFLATRSLALPIALHFGLNFLQGPVLGFGVSGQAGESAWIPAADAEMLAWHGGAFGLEASVPGFMAIAVLLAGLLFAWSRAVRRRAGAPMIAALALLLTCVPAANEARAVDVPDYANALRRKVLVEGEGPQRFTIAQRMRHYVVPGVGVAIVEGCRVVDVRGFGQADPAGRAVNVATLFQVGSVSKVVAAAGALRLVEQGVLPLDADIAPLLGDWRLPRAPAAGKAPVHLRHLLTHTAGINVPGFKGYDQGAAVPRLRQVFEGASPANTARLQVEHAPGSGWRYSGGGFVLVQRLVERAAGQSFADYLRTQVLRPAGMADSDYLPPGDATRRARAATGTLADGTAIPGGWRLYPEQAAAGLWTTPTDLSRFAIALVRSLRGEPGALLRQATAEDMLRRQADAWGLGVEISPASEPRKFSHTGAPVGFRTLWLMYPDTCQGATIMTNADEGMTLAYEIARAIADTRRWPEPMASERATAIAMTPAIAARFVGRYELVDFPAERFEVTAREDGRLAWSREGRQRRDLVATRTHELLSPDSGMRLVATQVDARAGGASLIELHFPGGANLARRIADQDAP